MTLIHLSAGEDILAVSDLLLSSPAHFVDSPINLPIHAEGLRFRTGDTSLSGLAQKAVIAGDRTLFLWAGSMIAARAIIAGALEASDGGREQIDFPALMAGMDLTDRELEAVSLIYLYDGENSLQEYHLNAEQKDYPYGFDVFAGSGAWDFTVNTAVATKDEPLATRGKRYFSILGKVINVLATEALNQGNFDYLYGGWLEICVFEDERFQKLPYAVKFWEISGSSLNTELPVFFSWYENRNLFIARMEVKGGIPSYDVHQIVSFINRDLSPMTETKVKWEPRIVFHVVRFAGSSKTDIYIQKDMEEEFSLSLKGSKTEVLIDKALIARIMRRDRSGYPGLVLTKPYDPEN